MRVPRLVGLMAVDARESARARALVVDAPGRPDFPHTVVDYVVRQYPQPGTLVPRHSVVHVWLDFGEGEGEGEGGGGVREPRGPLPPPGGPRRELEEPGAVAPLVVLSSP